METIKDFMYACETYEHSAEHYELMKECSELTLLEKFVDDQRFLLESADVIASGEVTFTEGFFTEAVSADKIAFYEGQVIEKAKSIIIKIRQGLSRLISKFVSFMKRVIASFKKSNYRDIIDKLGEVQDPTEALTDKSITDELVSIYNLLLTPDGKIRDGVAFRTIVDPAYTKIFSSDATTGEMMKTVIKNLFKDIPDTTLQGFMQTNGGNLEATAQAAKLLVAHAFVVTGADKFTTYTIPEWALPIDDICRILQGVAKGKLTYDATYITNEFEGLKKARDKKFTILLADPKLDEKLKLLESVGSELTDAFNDEEQAADRTEAVNKIYQMSIRVINDTMKLYSSLIANRNKAASALTAFLKKCKTSSLAETSDTTTSDTTTSDTNA